MALHPVPCGDEEESKLHSLQFKLTIPHQLLPNGPTVDTRFLELYPSTQLEMLSHSWPTSVHNMQLSIAYRLVASVGLGELQQSSPLDVSSCQRVIRIVPSKTEDPPLNPDFYPKEFILNSIAKVRRHLWSPQMARLHVSAEEPRPIDLVVVTPRAYTSIPVLLSFTNVRGPVEPWRWTFVVKSRIRLRAFYSIKQLEHEPTLDDVKGAKVFLRTEVVEQKAQHFKALDWTRSRPEINKVATDDMAGQQLWITDLCVTVDSPKQVTPSFLTLLAALRYSVELDISILGFVQSHAKLEVPLKIYQSLVRQPGETSSLSTSGFSSSSMDSTVCSREDISSLEVLPPYRYRS